jgi:hypothetical protein
MQNLGSSRLLPLLLRHAQPLSGAAGGSSVCSTAASLRAVSTSVASRAGPWGPGHDIGKTVDDSHIGQVGVGRVQCKSHVALAHWVAVAYMAPAEPLLEGTPGTLLAAHNR